MCIYLSKFCRKKLYITNIFLVSVPFYFIFNQNSRVQFAVVGVNDILYGTLFLWRTSRAVF